MEYTRLQFVSGAASGKSGASSSCAGDWVQVRSREEILATLDEQGRLDGMPFMPEMLAFCGKALPVFRRAHKACDTIRYSGAYKLERTVHLMDSRCDGSAHGGCDAGCLLYWNEAWLKPAPVPGTGEQGVPEPKHGRGCTMEQLVAATQKESDAEKGPRYVCQATNYLDAVGKRLSPYDLRHYIEDYRAGNVNLATLLRGAIYRLGIISVRGGRRLFRPIGLGDVVANAMMACYDAVQKLLPNGIPFPRRTGMIPKGEPTPQLGIGDLRPGSRVRVKSYREILATLDSNNKNRGLYFDAEHVPFCEKEFTVRSLVNRIVDERTGYMLHFKTPSIILQGSYCQGAFSDNRMFCPRSIYHFWRPIWLTPLDSVPADGDGSAKGERAA
jgi:hypothetical protein